ncbi:hypothetical protein D3C75_915970 [compost metagenome]
MRPYGQIVLKKRCKPKHIHPAKLANMVILQRDGECPVPDPVPVASCTWPGDVEIRKLLQIHFFQLLLNNYIHSIKDKVPFALRPFGPVMQKNVSGLSG